VDYDAILREAEQEADIILWDGGNNDTPFYQPDLWITVVDPHRPGHEIQYFPGETNLRASNVVIMNKIDTARAEDIEKVRMNIFSVNPKAVVIDAASPISVSDPSMIQGKRVLVIEDGPTLTHGGMTYGAGIVAARQYGAKEIVDPRPWVTGTIAETFRKYPDIGHLLPAMGYGEKQIMDLQATIQAVDCESVVIGTPINLARLIQTDKSLVRVQYQLKEKGRPDLKELLKDNKII